jgi:4-diphosphocytidyl-2-C-methyl-D-erythritol kinase
MEVSKTDASLTVSAPAKINLYLAVLGRRPDGYHDLATQMQKVDLSDTLHLAKIDRGIRLTCPESILPDDEANIAYRAARLFFAETAVKGGVAITLEKRIPIAAGLGGGSSDAAAVLKGLRQLYGEASPELLIRMARQLGADVPFFVEELDAAWATGIGDRLVENPVALPEWIVLVNPGFDVSTKWVYENFALTTRGNPYIFGRDLKYPFASEAGPGDPLVLYNDLESVTMERYGEVAALKDNLLSAGALGALMSGSGPTVFGLFAEKEAALNCIGMLSEQYDKVFLTRPLVGSHRS